MTLPKSLLEQSGISYILDKIEPASVFGRRQLHTLVPHNTGTAKELDVEFSHVQFLLELLQKSPGIFLGLEAPFMGFHDIRRTMEDGQQRDLSEVELFEVKSFLYYHQKLKLAWEALGEDVAGLDLRFDDLWDAFRLLDPDEMGTTSFYLSERYSPKLQVVRDEKRQNDRDLYTLTGEEKVEVETKRAEILSRERYVEGQVLHWLSEKLRPWLPRMLRECETIAALDLLIQKACFAREYGGVRPVLTQERVVFEDAVHLKTSEELESVGQAFRPITAELALGATVLTGANMGGKSVALKTFVQNLVLMRLGFFPLARSAAAPVFDEVLLLQAYGAEDRQGLSSFGGEIVRLGETLETLDTGYCFVAVDEFARGTNPEEGAALVAALTKYLDSRRCVAFLSTHFDHVAPHAGAHYRVRGLDGVDEQRLEEALVSAADRESAIYRFLDYGIVRVDKSAQVPKDALKISRLLGLREEILKEASETLLTNEK